MVSTPFSESYPLGNVQLAKISERKAETLIRATKTQYFSGQGQARADWDWLGTLLKTTVTPTPLIVFLQTSPKS